MNYFACQASFWRNRVNKISNDGMSKIRVKYSLYYIHTIKNYNITVNGVIRYLNGVQVNGYKNAGKCIILTSHRVRYYFFFATRLSNIFFFFFAYVINTPLFMLTQGLPDWCPKWYTDTEKTQFITYNALLYYYVRLPMHTMKSSKIYNNDPLSNQ